MHILLLALASCLLIDSAFPASIGLYTSHDCTASDLCIPPGRTGTIYIRVSTEGLPADQRFTGAEFRIVGLPVGWSAIIAPESGATIVGELFGEGGFVAFGVSHTGSCIPLGTVAIAAVSLATDLELAVTHHVTPSDPRMVCPRISVVCSGPCDISYCVDGGTVRINSSPACGLVTRRNTWSAVKGLYR